MQNKTIFYVVGGLVVIAVIVGVLMKKPSSPESASQSAKQSQESSLKDLIAKHDSQKCTFSQKTEGAETSGEVYVANGNMRGDFMSMMNGQSVKSHMIVTNNVSYVWSDMMAQGMKISFDQMEAARANANTQSQAQTVDINQRLNYDCNSWREDSSLFSLPSNITFTDMSAMMQAGMKANAGMQSQTGGNSAQCSYCDQITNANSKQQCKMALGCK